MSFSELVEITAETGLEHNAGEIQNLYPILYAELRRLAHSQLRGAWNVQTMCTTALVNEAYLKLAQHQQKPPANRSHFFAIAAQAMRQIIINYAESKQAAKRGGGWQQVTLADVEKNQDHDLTILVKINDALNEIQILDKDLASIIEMRFFAGMTEGEIAEVLDVSDRTVRRSWKRARALLTLMLEN
ncbi:hypothetical protein TDB9533_00771 [Thalassocella blandensis]|nr:hypothetical protein TDB9533_00771 [Thalassocella blandensis]